MLFEDTTTGALIVGHSLDKKLLAGRAAEIRKTLGEVATKHGVDVHMFVPGDSVTDHAHDPALALHTSSVYFGASAEQASCFDGPHPVSLARIHATRDKVAAIPAAFWAELASKVEELPQGFGTQEPEVYLMCFGPLPQVVLTFGTTHPREERGTAKYEYFVCQDMDQTPSDSGVDGVGVPIDGSPAFTEFDETILVPSDLLSETTLTELAAQVPSLESPGLFLTVRYD